MATTFALKLGLLTAQVCVSFSFLIYNQVPLEIEELIEQFSIFL